MGTRACVVIKKGQSQTILYRHYDGYPERLGCGYDLASRLAMAIEMNQERHNKSAIKSQDGETISAREVTEPTNPINDFMASLLTTPYDNHNHHYRITDELHGDLDFIYFLDFSNDEKLRFIIHRDYWDEGREKIMRSTWLDTAISNWTHSGYRTMQLIREEINLKMDILSEEVA